MNRSELLEVWTRYLDGGALSTQEQSDLLAGLDEDAALRQVLLQDWSIDGVLRSRAHDAEAGRRFIAGISTVIVAQADQGRFADRVRATIGRSAHRTRRPPVRAWRPVVLAASVCGAAIAAWLWHSGWAARSDLPVIAQSHQSPRIGDTLHLDAHTELDWRDGTHAVTTSESTVTVEDAAAGKRLQLTSGGLHVMAAPQPASSPMAISSRFATATVVGTDFTVTVTRESAQLTVEHGSVRFGHGAASDLLVGSGARAVADAFGARDPNGPIFQWSPHLAVAPVPVTGMRGSAPDGQACLVGAESAGLKVINFVRDSGWFAFDPRTIVTCRVWIGAQVAWAGFYFQDVDHRHHAQWHVPLDVRGAWRNLRFTLAEVVPTNGPLMASGDLVQYFMLQAQFAPSAELYVQDLQVHAPPAPP
jgi:hypothetical protein